MPNEVKLLPCPFCGSTDIGPDSDDGLHVIECRDCEAWGAACYSEAEAIAAWNTRPTTVVAGELQSVGDHALPPSGLSQSPLSQAKPAAAIADCAECERLREEITDYMGHRTDNVAGKVWAAECLFSNFESDLEALIGEFDGLGHDSYDQSLEIYGAPESARLSVEAQKLISDAGFGTVYLNHHERGVRANAWETIYSGLGRDELPIRGWRRRYVTDAKAETTREIGGDSPEERGYYEISYLPKGWNDARIRADVERGYYRVVPDPLDPFTASAIEARRAADSEAGAVHESAVAKPDAQKGSQ